MTRFSVNRSIFSKIVKTTGLKSVWTIPDSAIFGACPTSYKYYSLIENQKLLIWKYTRTIEWTDNEILFHSQVSWRAWVHKPRRINQKTGGHPTWVSLVWLLEQGQNLNYIRRPCLIFLFALDWAAILNSSLDLGFRQFGTD